jgi:hypothetical protein
MRGDTTTRSCVSLIALTVLTAACASTPTGPSVLVLPGTGKNFDQFRAEDARCRERASRELQTTAQGTVPAQGRYDMVYIQCMYAEGNQVPGPGGRSSAPAAVPTTRPPSAPPPPAGTPPPPPPVR